MIPWLGMRTRASLFIFFAFIFVLFLHPVNSSDFFHHIATGRAIVEQSAFPHTDTWTFTAQGKPWVAHSWGSGLLFYFVYELGGYTAISILFAGIGVAIAIMCYVLLSKLSIPQSIRIIAVATTAAIISLRWPSRPEVMAPLFVSALLLALLYITHKRYSYSIPILMLIWSIFYGSSTFLGLGIICIFLLTSRQISPHTIWISLLSILASFGNGYGASSFFYIFTIPRIAGYVGEWLPVTEALNPNNPAVVLFYQYQFLIYGYFTVSVIGMGIWHIFRKKSHKYTTFFLVIATSICLPFFAVRFINLAPILALPILAISIHHIPKEKIKLLCITLLALAGCAAIIVRCTLYPIGVGLDRPFTATSIQFLQKHNITGNIYTNQELGGYMHWVMPKTKIFYDTRDDLYTTTNIFSDLNLLREGKTDLLTILQTYRADIVLGEVDHEMFTPLLYQANWKLVYLGDEYFVAVRRALAEKYNLPSIEYIDPTRVPPAKTGSLAQAAKEMETIFKKNPTPEHTIRMAEILLSQDKSNEALALIERTNFKGFSGTNRPILLTGIYELRAKFYLATNHCDQAKTSLESAERYRTHPFIFSPRNNLYSTINRYWGQYYIDCERDIAKAKEYLLKYAVQTANSRERRQIELLIDSLQH